MEEREKRSDGPKIELLWEEDCLPPVNKIGLEQQDREKIFLFPKHLNLADANFYRRADVSQLHRSSYPNLCYPC